MADQNIPESVLSTIKNESAINRGLLKIQNGRH